MGDVPKTTTAKRAAKKPAGVMPGPADFVHLHNHTQYSLLDGLTKIDALMQFVRQTGMQSIAITDHGTLSGLIEFYKTAKANEVRPILGLETYVAARKLTDKDPAHDKQRYHLILLATNAVGYQNLMRLSTIANLQGYYYFPRVDHEVLEKYNEGLIALSGCMGSELGQAIKDDPGKARQIASWYKSVFGDRYYLEIQDHGHPDNPLHSAEQAEINRKVLDLGRELGIKCVVTSDAHYLWHEDQDAHEVLLCVGTGSFLSDTNRMSLKEFPLHVEEPAKIIERWGEQHPELIFNSREIAERCNVELELGKILIPKFPLPDGEADEKSYLHKLVYSGLAWRYGGKTRQQASQLTIAQAKKTLAPEILERAEYELKVIDSMGFNGYFLIIWDFIGWGKDSGIVFGPGRGSAAGSIVAYALRITELDPLRYQLLFERFLNPDRISMPDIDIDIADDRRNEVIEYCRQKYGDDRVANIVTFGRMAARNAVRDVSRVLQVPYAEADRLAKMIPPPVQGRHIPLAKSLVDNLELKAEYENNPQSRQVFDMAMRLEGTIRSHGVHAAGVVIAPDDIVKFIPLEMAQKGVVATQYSMVPVEELGLLKMDFLGLANLTIIKNALRIIKKVYDQDVDVNDIPLDDEATFKLLQAGETTGVFQLESAGMKRYLKELKPSVFDDIVAMVALYRPGPMQWIEDFINRKHGLKEISFLHPAMEPALRDTYGVIVYQEQVMQISKEMCGFTGGQADTLRKAIGKKNVEVMKKMKADFINGAVKVSGADPVMMEEFWKQLEDFAAYCFNKSHAACYGLIAYQTAYLKAHYPSAFMAALMTSDYDDTDRLSIEMSECKRVGIEVLPPDVNESFHEFAVVAKNKEPKAPVRFGLNAIKNVGSGPVEEIIVRRSEAPFKDLSDFLSRVNVHTVNRKALESLIKAGAMDSFGDRGSLLNTLDAMVSYAQKIQKDRASAQASIFGDSSDSEVSLPPLQIVPPATPLAKPEMLQWERELMGLYLSEHPLSDFERFFAEQAIAIAELKPEDDGQLATVGGTISDIRQIMTKNGQAMAFAKLEDLSGEMEIIVFPGTYKDQADSWQRDAIVRITGRVSGREKSGAVSATAKIIADSIERISHETAKNYQPTGKKMELKKGRRTVKTATAAPPAAPTKVRDQKLFVRIIDSSKADILRSLKALLEQRSGSTDVVLVLGNEPSKQIIKLPYKVTIDEETVRGIAGLVGTQNVIAQ